MQLFTGEQSNTVPAAAGAPPTALGNPAIATIANTLDEPIWETIKRDLIRIYRNLIMVVFPFKDRSQQSTALKNWDLWGPMIFTLTLAVLLSIESAKASSTFSLVFALVSIGAIVLTVNVVLLGGTIGFFQSLCLLGYCIFPLDAAALTCWFFKTMLIRWIVVPAGVLWATWASMPFIGGAVPENRRMLAVYPLVLLYTTIGWLALVS